jgi:transglutaminase-like putative cysteine protease
MLHLPRSKQTEAMKQTPHIRILLLALAAAFLPHVFWLPPWIAGFCFCLWLWRLLIDMRGWETPGRVTRLLLTGAGLVCMLLLWGTALGRIAGTGLLCLMLAVKPLETETHRDRMLLLLLALFLLFCSTLFSQSLLLGIYLFPAAGFLLAVLIRINHPRVPLAAAARRTATILLQAAPLGLVLFLLFPRLPGGIFGLEKRSSAGVTGISERMAPGSISRVARSEEVAFRADFRAEIPAPEHLYWRAVVLTLYNGREWIPGPLAGTSPSFRSASSKRSYEVILEPSGEKLLPVLDMPASVPDRARMKTGRILRARENVTSVFRYQATSVLDYTTGPPDPRYMRRCLQLSGRNPQTRSLVRAMLKGADDPESFIQKVQAHFRTQEFDYTLNPEQLDRQGSIDDFLFGTRSGFCEHYAQAAAWMLRAAGIPARIVAGYQGGETNPVGDYLIVRNSHAHAWVEAYVRGRGWVRVDPTVAVSGAGTASGDSAAGTRGRSWLGAAAPDWLARAWTGLRLGWDAVSHTWNLWVLGYDYSKQSALLQSLHLGRDAFRGLSRVILLATAIAFLLLGIYAAVLLKRNRPDKDRARALYDAYRAKLDRAGLETSDSEGPRDLEARVARERPDLAEEAGRIAGLYIRIRYQGLVDKQTFKQLRQAVSRLRPRKPPVP